MIQKLKSFSKKRKIVLLLVVIVIIAIFAINHFLPKEESVRYITQVPRMNDINISISGSGQVSSLKTVDISSKVSGSVIG